MINMINNHNYMFDCYNIHITQIYKYQKYIFENKLINTIYIDSFLSIVIIIKHYLLS